MNIVPVVFYCLILLGHILLLFPGFIEGLVKEAGNLSILLDLFADFSGLQINCAKSGFLGFRQSQVEEI